MWISIGSCTQRQFSCLASYRAPHCVCAGVLRTVCAGLVPGDAGPGGRLRPERHGVGTLTPRARASRRLTALPKYRVAAKELRESLATAKSTEEYQVVSARVAELETELHRERLARKHQLSEAVAARVPVDTEVAREVDAKALAEAFHTRTVPFGRGGLDSAEKPTPEGPAALAALVRRRCS